MCSNDCYLGCFIEDIVNSFEDFVKKSLIMVTVTIGVVIGMLLYLIKNISDGGNFMRGIAGRSNQTVGDRNAANQFIGATNTAGQTAGLSGTNGFVDEFGNDTRQMKGFGGINDQARILGNAADQNKYLIDADGQMTGYVGDADQSNAFYRGGRQSKAFKDTSGETSKFGSSSTASESTVGTYDKTKEFDSASSRVSRIGSGVSQSGLESSSKQISGNTEHMAARHRTSTSTNIYGQKNVSENISDQIGRFGGSSNQNSEYMGSDGQSGFDGTSGQIYKFGGNESRKIDYPSAVGQKSIYKDGNNPIGGVSDGRDSDIDVSDQYDGQISGLGGINGQMAGLRGVDGGQYQTTGIRRAAGQVAGLEYPAFSKPVPLSKDQRCLKIDKARKSQLLLCPKECIRSMENSVASSDFGINSLTGKSSLRCYCSTSSSSSSSSDTALLSSDKVKMDSADNICAKRLGQDKSRKDNTRPKSGSGACRVTIPSLPMCNTEPNRPLTQILNQGYAHRQERRENDPR